MEFKVQHYSNFTKDFLEIARNYSLDPDNLKIEFYTPRCQAILVERVENHLFKIHINLQENRIVAVQRISVGPNGNLDALKDKYRKFMK